MPDVEMPALGESVTEGTVTQWLKAEGDTVEVDEPLLEVSTDKVDTEIPSPVAGVLTKILVQEDETVEVGAKLAVVGDSDDASEDDSDEESAADDSAEQSSTSEDDSNDDEPEHKSESEGSDDSKPSAGSSGDSGDGERVAMPALGESVSEGTVTQWLKSEGDDVEVDEPLLEVSTDKVDTEIPSPVAGKLTKILVQEDETVEVGADLCIVGGSGGSDADGGGDKGNAGKDSSDKDAAEKSEQKAEPKQDQKQDKPSSNEQSKQSDEDDKRSAQSADPATPEKSSVTTDEGDKVYVTPLVRKLAKEHDVDLTTVEGSGVGGRIRKHDVLEAAKSQKSGSDSSAQSSEKSSSSSSASSSQGQDQKSSAPAGRRSSVASDLSAKRGTTEKMSRLRKTIAERMMESLHGSAQLTTVVEVDVTNIAHLRTKEKEDFQRREGVKLSFMPFFAIAAIDALKEFPQVNASIEDDTVIYHEQENLGIAVDTPAGLLVPVIKDAGDLNIAGLARKIADLAERTRAKKVMPDELSGGTFTLTNTGSRGALFDTPIINQPQVAILGTGSVVKRPVVVPDTYGNESIAVRSMVYLALTYDHRLVDGADAARFLTAIKDRLEGGNFEL